MRFPAATLIDDFNRANEGPPPTGWTDWWGDGLKVISNQLAPNNTTEDVAYWTTAMGGANVDAWVEIATLGVTASSINLYARLDPAGGGSGYFVHHKVRSGSDELYLYRFSGGALVALASDLTQNLVDGDALGIRCSDSTIEGWVRLAGTWLMFGSAVDATYSGASPNTKIGIYFEGNGSATQRADNLYASAVSFSLTSGSAGTLTNTATSGAAALTTSANAGASALTNTATSGAAALTIPATSGVAGSPIGVYEGAGELDDVQAFESWLGRSMDYVLDFMPGGTWDEIKGTSWTPLWGFEGSPYIVVISPPMFPSGGTLAAGAAGTYNSHWTDFATNLAGLDLVEVIVRPGWEFGGGWYDWAVDTAQKAADYATYFANIVTAMRAVTPGMKSVWNPIWGWQSVDPTLAYPGDDYVDYIGLDVYDQSWVDDYTNPVARWNDILAGTYGLNFWVDFASDHSKPLCLPEWGLAIRGDGHGGGDAPYFIQAMADWIEANNVAWHMYFNFDAGDGLHELHPSNQFPLGKADFITRFGPSFGPSTLTLTPL